MCPLSNTQRPGAVVNMTMEEYQARETEEVEGRPVTTIAVASHKTAMSGAAVLHLDVPARLCHSRGQVHHPPLQEASHAGQQAGLCAAQASGRLW